MLIRCRDCGAECQTARANAKTCPSCRESRAALFFLSRMQGHDYNKMMDDGITGQELYECSMEIALTLERAKARIEGDAELIAKGREVNHRVSLLPEVSDALGVSVLR